MPAPRARARPQSAVRLSLQSRTRSLHKPGKSPYARSSARDRTMYVGGCGKARLSSSAESATFVSIRSKLAAGASAQRTPDGIRSECRARALLFVGRKNHLIAASLNDFTERTEICLRIATRRRRTMEARDEAREPRDAERIGIEQRDAVTCNPERSDRLA